MADKFAMDIRNPNAIVDLYEKVDKALAAFGVSSGGISDEAQAQTVAHSLHRLINENEYFADEVVYKCAKMANIVISQERENIYKSVRYIYWNQMDPKYRQLLVGMILDDFRSILLPKK